VRFDELMDIRSSEPDLRALMISGLDGDAAAHRVARQSKGCGNRRWLFAADDWRNKFELNLGPLFEVPLGGGSFSELCIKSLHQSCGIEAVHAR
jgi:hypothetical protein